MTSELPQGPAKTYPLGKRHGISTQSSSTKLLPIPPLPSRKTKVAWKQPKPNICESHNIYEYTRMCSTAFKEVFGISICMRNRRSPRVTDTTTSHSYGSRRHEKFQRACLPEGPSDPAEPAVGLPMLLPVSSAPASVAVCTELSGAALFPTGSAASNVIAALATPASSCALFRAALPGFCFSCARSSGSAEPAAQQESEFVSRKAMSQHRKAS
jgi:hypothetical protein